MEDKQKILEKRSKDKFLDVACPVVIGMYMPKKYTENACANLQKQIYTYRVNSYCDKLVSRSTGNFADWYAEDYDKCCKEYGCKD